MAGVAIFDSALVAYPLYMTSKHILAARDLDDDAEVFDRDAYAASDRWLTFWLTFGLVELVQGFGADGIPGFHLAKAAVLLSLYSVEHATLIGALIPRVCSSYITAADRGRKWWTESAVPRVKKTVVNTTWITSAQTRVSRLFGWGPSDSDSDSDDDE